MDEGEIIVRGARTHNLADVSVRIPRGRLTVVSGVSGSGKSSLAFDTLFAEGRRRYLESLPSAARRFLEKLPRPDVDVVEGLAPAIALRQSFSSPDPRSTVATLADIHGHLRLLFANLGVAHCPKCARPIAPISPGALSSRLLHEKEGTRIEILSPAWLAGCRRSGLAASASDAASEAAKDGFVRLVIDGNHMLVEDVSAGSVDGARRIDVVIDRIVAKDGIRTRLADSVELAMKRSGGEIRILLRRPGQTQNTVVDESERLLCPACNLVFDRLVPSSFSFNSRLGACRACGGLGRSADGTVCAECGGTRLLPAPRACTIETGDKPFLTLPQVLAMPASAISEWAGKIAAAVPPPLRAALSPVLSGLVLRLGFLEKTGLGYLAADRPVGTLSSGEMRRVQLCCALGQDLSGALYVLDEPTAGLHPSDTATLLTLVKNLCERRNTVVMVEHDEAAIRAADHLIDMGPGAGALGGRVVFSGPVENAGASAESPTGAFLSGREKFYTPAPKKPDCGFIEILGAKANNLHVAVAHFPVGCITVVAGVSGAGKSSLVEDVLGANVESALASGCGKTSTMRWTGCSSIRGLESIRRIVRVGRAVRTGSSRSVVATACGAFDRIRALFAATPLARARGYSAARFSFANKGGRCETCKGEGETKLEMAFLPDCAVTCEECGGSRYNRETLDVHWSGRSVADILSASISEAAVIFRSIPPLAGLFSTIDGFGLGYLTLGQRTATLSGGEAQRLLLATELSSRSVDGTLYILDEPAAGQHARDVNRLLRQLEALRDAGATIVVVEHRPQVMSAADWLLDMGPGAGSNGGLVAAEGPPRHVAALGTSPSAPFLHF